MTVQPPRFQSPLSKNPSFKKAPLFNQQLGCSASAGAHVTKGGKGVFFTGASTATIGVPFKQHPKEVTVTIRPQGEACEDSPYLLPGDVGIGVCQYNCISLNSRPRYRKTWAAWLLGGVFFHDGTRLNIPQSAEARQKANDGEHTIRLHYDTAHGELRIWWNGVFCGSHVCASPGSTVCFCVSPQL
jgi:hypothetical protein